jgi:hypothetical protein
MAEKWSYARATVGLYHADSDATRAFVVADGHLHGELDAVCPRCLQWIEERDYVRRTAYGPLQHEVCPAATSS